MHKTLHTSSTKIAVSIDNTLFFKMYKVKALFIVNFPNIGA